MPETSLNGRFAWRPVTGVERFAEMSTKGWTPPSRMIKPPAGLSQGVRGHVWEQLVLPTMTRGQPLLSLCNFGPIAYRRQLVVFHDAAAFEHPEWFSNAYARQTRLVWQRLSRTAEILATVSQESATRLARVLDVPRERFHVLTPGVDALSAQPTEGEYTHGDYFVVVGSLEPRKNLPRLLEAWARAKNRLPEDMKLLIVGGRQSAVFAKDTSPAGPISGVEPLGRLSDAEMARLIAGSRGFVYVPLYEGFGLPPLEAAWLGVPSLVSEIPAVDHSLREHFIVVDAHDVDSISSGLVKLHTDPPRAAARNLLPTWSRTSHELQGLVDAHWGSVRL